MMTERLPVAVLLSSYNGEKYIEEQIASIFNQRGVTVRLFVRDDGSTDSSIQILKNLIKKHDNICVALQSNIGVIGSFFELLEQAPASSQYFALSDQDDVWHPDKLLNAISALEEHDSEMPLLYCSAVEYVDALLQHRGFSPIYSDGAVGFENALVQNVATGCTMVMNRSALFKIAAKLPVICVMHDWWIYLVISAVGKVIYDPRPAMQYRQHSNNVFGVAQSPYIKFKRRCARLLNAEMLKPSEQLATFYQLYGEELSAAQCRQVQQLVFYKKNIFTKFAAMLSRGFHRQSGWDNVLIRLTILIGKF